jgi:BlaI family transcriptional regulator, penicillinase repressor
LHYDNFRTIFVYENNRTINMQKKYQPTESELEILQVLWEKGTATVREVHEVLDKQKDVGYTTTLKTMQIMHEKGLLERDTTNRTHIYAPSVSQETTQEHFLNKMIDGLYKGSAGRLVIGALGQQKISPDELQEIKEFLKQFEKQ